MGKEPALTAIAAVIVADASVAERSSTTADLAAHHHSTAPLPDGAVAAVAAPSSQSSTSPAAAADGIADVVASGHGVYPRTPSRSARAIADAATPLAVPACGAIVRIFLSYARGEHSTALARWLKVGLEQEGFSGGSSISGCVSEAVAA